jgi:tetrapyrrole methylase family protein/MazG family protein/ATP diphosphatase
LPVPQQQGQTLPRLVELMQRLLAPDGCPWDREQTPASLRRYVLEEACEVIDAIDTGDAAGLQEELGDLLLQVVFLSELARAEHGFGPDDVVFGICEKLVRRHPHVFEEVQLEDAGAVARQWEVLKAREKPKRRGLLARVPRSLPGLERAQRIGKEVRRVGFDWPEASGSRAKLQEELAELDAAVDAGDAAEIEAELGDLLFAAVNLARHHGVDAARALQRTNDKFCRRFAHVERRVQQELGDWPRDAEGQPTAGISLEQLDGYWNEAKASPEPEPT